MDPDTARLALDLQLQDAEEVLRTTNRGPEAAAFRVLRAELLRKRGEIEGQCTAMNMLRREHGAHEVHQRLVAEERRAQGDHVLASALAGEEPAPQPALREEPAQGEQNEILNGNPERRLAIDDPGVMQTAYAPPVEASSDLTDNDNVTSGARTHGPRKRESSARQKEREAVCESDASSDEEVTTVEESAESVKPAEELPLRNSLQFLGRPAQRRNKLSSSRPSRLRSSILTLETNKPAVEESQKPGNQKLIHTALHGENNIATSRVEGAISESSQNIARCAECSGCLERRSEGDMLQLSCPSGGVHKHQYCQACLQAMFEVAIADSERFPPRCCHPLELDSCTPFLSKDLIARFQEKKEELETTDRTYCSKAECAKWIKPVNIEAGVGICPACDQKTCTSCSAVQHEGLCPEDEDVKALLALAEQRRWKSCTDCKNMVELDTGCYHITCRCKHQFCYLCQAQWKTCGCEHAAQDNIWPDAAAEENEAAAANDPPIHQHVWRQRHRIGYEAHCQGCRANWLPWMFYCDGCDRFTCRDCQ